MCTIAALLSRHIAIRLPQLWENQQLVQYPSNVNASRDRCMAPDNTCVYSHSEFTAKALAQLEERAAHPEVPFFLYLAYTGTSLNV